MNNPITLRALAEIRQNQVLMIKANPVTKDAYDNAHAYAIIHSVYPIFHEDKNSIDLTESSDLFPFYKTYNISCELVNNIFNLMKEKEKEGITFYQIENLYNYGDKNWDGQEIRNDLINICRYFYLDHRFNENFWQVFLSDAPNHATDITKEWTIENLTQVVKL